MYLSRFWPLEEERSGSLSNFPILSTQPSWVFCKFYPIRFVNLWVFVLDKEIFTSLRSMHILKEVVIESAWSYNCFCQFQKPNSLSLCGCELEAFSTFKPFPKFFICEPRLSLGGRGRKGTPVTRFQTSLTQNRSIQPQVNTSQPSDLVFPSSEQCLRLELGFHFQSQALCSC